MTGSGGNIMVLQVFLLLNCLLTVVNSQATPTPNQPQTCHSFHCKGEMCYQETKYSNLTSDCKDGEQYCELYRFTPTHYMARCSHQCINGRNGTRPCRMPNDTVLHQDLCSLECCRGSRCLSLNATAYGDKGLTTPSPLAPALPTSQRNGKVCVSFSCKGNSCFRGQKTETLCPLGSDFCEMKKTNSGYEAGCSQACLQGSPVCSQARTGPCYQECCRARPSTSCLRLDGSIYFNQAANKPENRLLSGMMATTILFLLIHYGPLPFLPY